MSKRGIEALYPQNLEPLDQDALDAYLSGIERVETHKAPAETIKNPRSSIPDRMERVTDAVRHIEVLRRQIAYQASVLCVVYEQSPETINALPDDERTMVLELISRLEASTA